MFKAYASYYSSFLLAQMPPESVISTIILFGSAAKGDASTESDIDIFIEVERKSKNIEGKIAQITEKFYKSREALLFKVKGIDNKINVIVGKLAEWTELRKSVESTGIILYGKYIPTGGSGRKFALIFWEVIGKNRGAFLNKLYGFNFNKKRYSGLLEKNEGRKVGKSSIMIPVEHSQEVLKLIQHHKVKAKIVEIYV